MALQIISGRVAYERTVKDDDYGINRKFAGEFSFTAEAETEVVRQAAELGDTLVALVHQRLNAKGAAKAQVSVGTAATPAAGVVSPTAQPAGTKEAAAKAMNAADDAVKAPKGRKPKETPAPAADPLAEMTGGAPAAGKSTGATETKTPAASVDPLADLGGATDELDALLGETSDEAPPPAVSDADLAKAITKKAGEIKDAPRIRALAERFGGGPAPKQIRDIPANKRWQFIQELNSFKPA